MNDLLTMEELEARYTGEWVLLEDPETDGGQRVTRGKLLWHSPDIEDVERKDLELKPHNAAVIYVGDPPRELAYVL